VLSSRQKGGSACGHLARGAAEVQPAVAASIGLAVCAQTWAAPDFSGVWGTAARREDAGAAGTAAFLQKGAGLITQLDQRILRRLPDLSF